MEYAAYQTIAPSGDPALNDGIGRSTWMGQLDLYSALRADTSLMDTSTILHSFMAAAAGSRYEWICKLADTVQAGDYTALAAMISSPPAGSLITGANCVRVRDTGAGDSIVANYLAYYDLFLKWQAQAFTAVDSEALALLSNKCPLVEGAAVYKARVLRSLITGELVVYTDNCGGITEEDSGENGNGDGGNERRTQSGIAEAQQYALLPNPNDGDMQLIQMLRDNAPVSITVYNAIGQVVYKGARVFKQGQADLHLSVASGLYHVVLSDGTGRSYNLKFVKK